MYKPVGVRFGTERNICYKDRRLRAVLPDQKTGNRCIRPSGRFVFSGMFNMRRRSCPEISARLYPEKDKKSSLAILI